MTTRKLFIGTSALILAFVGVFANKTSNKFTTGVYYKTANGLCKLLTSSINSTYFTTSGTDQAVINTTGGTKESLFGNSACGTVQVFFKGQ
jgi:hypothetical protein